MIVCSCLWRHHSIPLQYNQMSAEAHQCCKVHLTPLLQRIGALEGKLLLEVQRREKEYNQLLTALLLFRKGQPVKEDGEIKGEKGKSGRRISRANAVEISELGKTRGVSSKKKILQQKERIKTGAAQHRERAKGGKGVELPDVIEPRQLNLRTTESEKILQRLNTLEANVGECGDEVAKSKQLQNYMMEQVLSIFQRLNSMQNSSKLSLPTLGRHEREGKTISTQETIPSQLTLHPQTPTKHDSPSRWSGFSPHKDNPQLSDVMVKILEHESVLSELIGLTRQLSGRFEALIK